MKSDASATSSDANDQRHADCAERCESSQYFENASHCLARNSFRDSSTPRILTNAGFSSSRIGFGSNSSTGVSGNSKSNFGGSPMGGNRPEGFGKPFSSTLRSFSIGCFGAACATAAVTVAASALGLVVPAIVAAIASATVALASAMTMTVAAPLRGKDWDR